MSSISETEPLRLLERLLGTADEALGARDVLDLLFASGQAILPHDGMSISFTNSELTHIQLYAASGGLRHLPMRLESRIADPALVTRPWEFELIDDMAEDERYRQMPSAQSGMRSAIVIPLRFAGQLRGWVNFFSKSPHAYAASDAPAARRIAAHVALALSFDLLTEQRRNNVELRARAANLKLLDELLATLPDSVELSALFDRVSALAGNVLAHDAAVLAVYLNDGTRAGVHASHGFAPPLPDIVDLPPDQIADPDRHHEVIGELAARGEEPYQRFAAMGFRSLLRVPIRLERRTAGAMLFLAKAAAAFEQADVLLANRVATRLAVAMARDRERDASKRADEATARAARLEARVRALTDELDARSGFRRVVGDSSKWKQVLTQATQVAATETTALLLGESGTGKEVIARFVHRASPRSRGPFVALNCAALPEQLLEAELFGYERGAFTGATQSKPGQLEQAAGGTLFLDEVGEMSLSAQAKFLRVLQEREFQRLGGTRVLRTDARIVAATNRDLQKAIVNNQFREDLFYRLNVFAIRLPALRERPEDILLLSDAFLSEIGKGLGRPPSGVSRSARNALVGYAWPGNVRELRNVLERAAILCDGGLITDEHLAISAAPPLAVTPSVVSSLALATVTGSSGVDLSTMERTMIEEALRSARFNKSKAAKQLGLTRHQLYIRMRKYGLE
jgi:transcriptional regulator with GAF, ATPase, and Fis domain